MHGYAEVIRGEVTLGRCVAVIGAGGIGFDVSEFLTHAGRHGAPQDVEEWQREWGVADPAVHRGGLATAAPPASARVVYPLQRKFSRPGAGLGKTSGSVHRSTLRAREVEMLSGSPISASTTPACTSPSEARTPSLACWTSTTSSSAPGRNRAVTDQGTRLAATL